MENSEKNKYDFTLLYYDELDSWILQIEDEELEQKSGQLKGTVIYVGYDKSKQEKEDELLDLILQDDDDRVYYEEILRIITSIEL
tara:strand:- start:253 stop:507 length:255 start_codon:yes stop_codon:yes gene_type:complete